MGAEAQCVVRLGGETFDAKVLLETDEVIVRGEHRVTIPFATIRSVRVKEGVLTLASDGKTISLQLGPKAGRWAEKIRVPRSRIEKLGVKAGVAVQVVDVSDPTFVSEVAAAGAVIVKRASDAPALVFLEVASSRDLPRITKHAKTLPPASSLWVIHPKGPAGVKDTDIFAVAKQAGLTYTKMARFSETHTAERLVWPKASR